MKYEFFEKGVVLRKETDTDDTLMLDIFAWLGPVPGYMAYSNIIYFKNEKDQTLFMMRWTC